MKTEKQRRFAVAGGLFGAAYLTLNNLLPAFPDVLTGLILGLAVVLLLLALLPEEVLDKLRRRKGRGE